MDPRQVREERIKAWIRSHRWRYAFVCAATVASAFVLFALGEADSTVRGRSLLVGAVLTVIAFVFFAWRGPRLASRPPSSESLQRRRRRFLLLMALLFGVGIVIGLVYAVLTK